MENAKDKNLSLLTESMLERFGGDDFLDEVITFLDTETWPMTDPSFADDLIIKLVQRFRAPLERAGFGKFIIFKNKDVLWHILCSMACSKGN